MTSALLSLRNKTAVITGVASGKPVGVSVLCPGYVDTGIADAGRHRPAELADSNPDNARNMERTRLLMKAGRLTAADVARITLDAAQEGRFYVFPHLKAIASVEMRLRDLLDGRTPNNPLNGA